MILVDSNEPPEIIKALDYNKIAYRREQTKVDGERVADFMNEQKTVGIERKQASDLISSLTDGRLRRQMRALRSHFPIGQRIIIIEGNLFTEVNKFPRSRGFRKFILSTPGFFVRHGFTVITTASINETVQQAESILHQFTKPESNFAINTAALPNSGEDAIDGLLVIPGVGPKTAEAIMNKCLNLEAVKNWATSGNDKIEGIGSKTKEKIMEHFIKPFRRPIPAK